MKNGRFLVLLLLMLGLVSFAFGLVGTAAADPPDREDLEPVSFTITGCEFPVLLEDLKNNETITTFYDKEGNVRLQLITGALKVRLTNLDTDKSIVLNIPGPGRFEPQADGTALLTTMGPWLLFELGIPELPAVSLVKGRAELLFDELGNVELLSLQGTVEDVCPMLAGS